MKKMSKMIGLLVALVVFATTCVPAFASNNGNTNLPTNFISFGTNATTLPRSKTDTSKVYVKNTSGMSLWIYANGGVKPSGSISPTYSTGTTIGGYVIVPVGQFRIRTTIKEKGYGLAWLNISTATNGVSGNCSGEWSPDSTGSSPVIN